MAQAMPSANTLWVFLCLVSFCAASPPEIHIGLCSDYNAKSMYLAKLAFEEGLMDNVVPNKNFSLRLSHNGYSCGRQQALAFGASFFTKHPLVHAVAGCGCSGASMALMVLADAYQVPLVSPSSTNEQLSDKANYKYFSRIIPPDSMQSLGLAKLIVHFEWKRQLVIMHDRGAYSTGIATRMRENLESIGRETNEFYNIIFTRLPMEQIDWDVSHMLNHDQTLLNAVARRVANLRPQPRIFTAPALARTTSLIIQAFNLAGLVHKSCMWILSDSACTHAGILDWPSGFISPDPNYQLAVDAGSFLSNDGTGPGQYDRQSHSTLLRGMMCMNLALNNSWLYSMEWNSFWQNVTDEKMLNAGLPASLYGDDAYTSWKNDAMRESWSRLEFDATMAIIVGVGRVLQNGMSASEFKGDQLLEGIRLAVFQGLTGEIRFDSVGDRMASYNVVNLQLIDSVPTFVSIGVYDGPSQKLVFHHSPIFADNTTQIPSDRSPPCSSGSEYVDAIVGCRRCSTGMYAQIKDSDECIPCAEGRFASQQGQTVCATCPAGTMSLPVANQSIAGPSACAHCQVGRFAANVAQIECEDCGPGTYQSQLGQSACDRCEVGYFTSITGASECIACINDLSTQLKGAASKEDCKCPAGLYAEYLGGECFPCPRGMSCVFGSTIDNFLNRSSSSLPYPELRTEYWSSADEPVSVFKCKTDSSCPGGDPGTCGEGLHGQACSLCWDGWRWTGSQCKECPPRWVGLIIFPMSILLATPVFVLITYLAFDRPFHQWGSWQTTIGSVLFALLNFSQILSLLSSVTVGMPSVFSDGLSAWLWTIDIFEYFQLECVGLRQVERRMALKCSGPLFVGVCCIALFGISHILSRISKTTTHALDANRITNVFFTLIYSFFNAVVILCFFVFNCVSHPNGVNTLRSDYSIDCFTSGTWSYLVCIAIIACIVYLGGFGSLFSWAIFTAPRNFKSLSFQVRWKFLFIKYRPDVFWWSLTFIAKTILLNMAFLLFYVSILQLLWMIAVIVAYTALVSRFAPYRHSLVNALEILISVAIISAAALMAWFVDREDGKYDKAIALAGFFIALVPIFVSVACIGNLLWTRYFRQQIAVAKTLEDLSYVLRATDGLRILMDLSDSERMMFWEQIGDWGRWHMMEVAHLAHGDLLGQVGEADPTTSRSTFQKYVVGIGAKTGSQMRTIMRAQSQSVLSDGSKDVARSDVGDESRTAWSNIPSALSNTNQIFGDQGQKSAETRITKPQNSQPDAKSNLEEGWNAAEITIGCLIDENLLIDL